MLQGLAPKGASNKEAEARSRPAPQLLMRTHWCGQSTGELETPTTPKSEKLRVWKLGGHLLLLQICRREDTSWSYLEVATWPRPSLRIACLRTNVAGLVDIY